MFKWFQFPQHIILMSVHYIDEFALIDTLISMQEKSGLTQVEVAERMGTKAPNISRIESGKANPSLKH